MQTQNGTTSEAPHVLKAQLESLRSEVSKLIDRVTTGAAESRLKTFAGIVTEAIKAHPIAAITAAFGAGYVLTRIVRR